MQKLQPTVLVRTLTRTVDFIAQLLARGIPVGFTLSGGFPEALGTYRRGTFFDARGLESQWICVQNELVHKPLRITVRLSGYLPPERNVQLARLRQASTSAGNHDTTVFCCSSKNVTSAPLLARATTVCFWTGGRRASNPCWQFWRWIFTWHRVFREFRKTTVRLGITLVLHQIRHSGGAHRQNTIRSVTRSSTAARQVKNPEIHGPIRGERSVDRNLSRIPKASAKLSDTGRSSFR